jgi:hypothetical protein
LIGDFYNINILSREVAVEIEANESIHEVKKSLGGVAHQAGHATKSCLALGGSLASVFLCTPLF